VNYFPYNFENVTFGTPKMTKIHIVKNGENNSRKVPKKSKKYATLFEKIWFVS
jgi:hypothetical protein